MSGRRAAEPPLRSTLWPPHRPDSRGPELGLGPRTAPALAVDTGTPEAPGKRHPLFEADKQAPAALRAVLGRARLQAELGAAASLASHQLDRDVRGRGAHLDRYIRLLDQQLEPSKDHPLLPRRPAQPPMPGQNEALDRGSDEHCPGVTPALGFGVLAWTAQSVAWLRSKRLLVAARVVRHFG